MRHLLTGALVLTLLGCAAQSSGAQPDTPATAAARTDDLDLAGLAVSDAVMYRDGGSIELTGRTPSHAKVLVRYDGKHGSETRGTVFVSPDGQASSLRPMTGQEVDALLQSLRQPAGELPAGVDPVLVQTLADHLETYRPKAS